MVYDIDSGDANFGVGTEQNRIDTIAKIEGWVSTTGPGIITLEHDISAFTSGIAIEVIEGLEAVPGLL
jgi:hypothetical protein